MTLRELIRRRTAETNAPTNEHRALHWLTTRAISAGLIDRQALWKDGGYARDQRKAADALEDLYRRLPRRVEATLERYLAEKIQQAEQAKSEAADKTTP